MAKILIVDDEAAIRNTFRDILEFEKYTVEDSPDGLDALVKLKQSNFDVIIMDIKMPKMDGMETLERIQILTPDTPVIMISGHADINTAVEAVKKGAFDFVSKPLDLNRMLITVRNAMDKSSLIVETKVLKKRFSKSKTQNIIGESSVISSIKDTIDRVAPTEARVLITGSNGTGKELVARWIHEKSARRDFPIIEVNCAAIPSELIESELFGHEKGSFTSAYKQRIGKFEQANGGTIFLDEIGDMSLDAQAKVLRALQENVITRVGGEKDIRVDVRVIAATNKNLREEIDNKRFREDLYHRLAVIVIEVPTLNNRREDIPLLITHFNNLVSSEYSIDSKVVTDKAITGLQNYNWTGNIRELRNVMERLIILSGEQITLADVDKFVTNNTSPENSKLSELFEKYNNIDDLLKFVKNEYEKTMVQNV
ncbi:MAG: two-component system nitrogen regulation response regulator NtrX [Saprospiraceae bacterium]|jgi:two-component system nitrogen regulation response regulator NtrX